MAKCLSKGKSASARKGLTVMDPTSSAPVVGIDISKDRLDVACLPESVQPLTCLDNDAHGHASLIATLRVIGPRLIVLEAPVDTNACSWPLWPPRGCPWSP